MEGPLEGGEGRKGLGSADSLILAQGDGLWMSELQMEI